MRALLHIRQDFQPTSTASPSVLVVAVCDVLNFLQHEVWHDQLGFQDLRFNDFRDSSIN